MVTLYIIGTRTPMRLACRRAYQIEIHTITLICRLYNIPKTYYLLIAYLHILLLLYECDYSSEVFSENGVLA